MVVVDDDAIEIANDRSDSEYFFNIDPFIFSLGGALRPLFPHIKCVANAVAKKSVENKKRPVLPGGK